jgi:hypothetical protein
MMRGRCIIGIFRQNWLFFKRFGNLGCQSPSVVVCGATCKTTGSLGD